MSAPRKVASPGNTIINKTAENLSPTCYEDESGFVILKNGRTVMILLGSVIDRTLTCRHCNQRGLYRVKGKAALNALFYLMPVKPYECMHCGDKSYHFKIFAGGRVKMDARVNQQANSREIAKPYL